VEPDCIYLIDTSKHTVLMDDLLKKLNYKGERRIAVINGSDEFIDYLRKELNEVQIDRDIDQRFPYEFMIFFVKLVSEVKILVPKALHNLTSDGTLWFAYPKKTSKKLSSDIDRDHGWEVLIDRGFDRVRRVAIDTEWAALRFRNVRYIKSNRGRFS
jgi:hypothetical protein